MISLNRASFSTLFVVLFSTALFGQTFTGHVYDTTGAAVPGATITIHNQLTSVDTRSKTTDAGNYTVPYLKPGLYSVSAEMKGFQEQIRTDITLDADSTVAVDFTLKVGAVVGQTVTVTADQVL